MILILSIADLLWSVSAWIYDWHKLITLPVYLIPFILTCPIFPLLLSVSWFQIFRKRKLNLFIFYLGVLGSVVYGVGAILYYTSLMTLVGFDWWTFGGIFWVLFYALQGGYLLFRYKAGFNLASLISAGAFLGAKLIIDFTTRTSGYIVDDIYPQNYLIIMFVVMVAVFVLTLIKFYLERKIDNYIKLK